MSRVREQDEYQTALLINGLPTCVFRSKPYHRIVTSVVLGNSNPSAVKCYRGVVGSVPVASNLVGANNTVRGEIVLPAGQPFFVQWSTIGAQVKDAFAKVSFDKEDDPASFKNPLSGLVWDYDLTSIDVGTITDQTSVSKVLVYDQTVTQTVVLLDHGTFFVGNMPYVYIKLSIPLGVGGARLSLAWYSDKTLTDFIGQDNADSRGDIWAQGAIPVLAPYLRLFTSTDIQPRQIHVEVWQTQQAVTTFDGAAGNSLIAIDQFLVGAGTVVAFDAATVRWGWGYWYADLETPIGGRRIKLQATDYAGNRTLVDVVLASKESQKTLLLLPPQPLRIEVNNVGAAANFWGVLYHHAGPV